MSASAVEVVHGAGVRRAGVADEQEGRPARGAVAARCASPSASARTRNSASRRDLADVALRETREHAPPSGSSGASGRRRRSCPSRKFSGRRSRRAATSAEKFESEPPVVRMPPASRGIADDRAEPADDVRLDLRRGPAPRRRRRRSGSSRPAIEVRDGGLGQSAARDVGEVAGTGRVEALRDHRVEEEIEEPSRRVSRSPAVGSRRDRASSGRPAVSAEGCAGSDSM